MHQTCPGTAEKLAALWDLSATRFTSQAFGDAFDQIAVPNEDASGRDDLQEAQRRLPAAWPAKHLASPRVLACDMRNVATCIASTNTHTRLARRGHNRQGRHNLRRVGLTYLRDGERGPSLCHHVYPGHVSDAVELPAALPRVTRLPGEAGMARGRVTLVSDKGTSALTNTVALAEAGIVWVSVLPWNQAPVDLFTRALGTVPFCGWITPACGRSGSARSCMETSISVSCSTPPPWRASNCTA